MYGVSRYYLINDLKIVGHISKRRRLKRISVRGPFNLFKRKLSVTLLTEIV